MIKDRSLLSFASTATPRRWRKFTETLEGFAPDLKYRTPGLLSYSRARLFIRTGAAAAPTSARTSGARKSLGGLGQRCLRRYGADSNEAAGSTSSSGWRRSRRFAR